MDALDPVASLARWTALRPAARAALLEKLAAALGPAWSPGETAVGRAGLGELVHAPDARRYVVAPGGWLRMGFSVDDVLHAQLARVDPASKTDWLWELRRARPTRLVQVRAFLVARELSSTPERVDARIELPDGARLPSEAEMEWLLREGGVTRFTGLDPAQALTAKTRWKLLGGLANGFGLAGVLNTFNLCEDDAHEGYAGAPGDARAWGHGRAVARMGHTYWQDSDAELIALHAACRGSVPTSEAVGVRPVFDLPDAPAPDAPDRAPTDHATTLRALRSANAKVRGAALRALATLVDTDASDGAPVVADVLQAAKGLDDKTRHVVLAWLADVATGDHRHAPSPFTRERRDPAREACLAAVQSGAGYYLYLLGEDDAKTQSLASLALAYCPDHAGEVIPAATKRYAAATKPGVQASLLLAIGSLGAATGASTVVLPALAPKARGAVAAAHAIASAWLGAPEVDALLAAGAQPDAREVPFFDGRLGEVAIELVRAMGPEARARGALSLAGRIASMDPAQATALTWAALALVFDEQPEAPDPTHPDPLREVPLRLDELTPAQRALIDAVARLPIALEWQRFRLFDDVADRRRWLGEAPGPLDALLATDAGPVPAWWALRELQARACRESWTAERARDAGLALLAGLDAVDVLLMLLDAGRYGLNVQRWVREGKRVIAGFPIDHKELEARIAAAVALDRARTRDAVFVLADQLLASAAKVYARPVLLACAMTLEDGATLPARFDALIKSNELQWAYPPEILRALGPARLERTLLASLASWVSAAARAKTFAIGCAPLVRGYAKYVAICPSPRLARTLLSLGWAGGQPGEARALIGERGAGSPEIAAVLAEYDALPEVRSWKDVLRAMKSFGPSGAVPPASGGAPDASPTQPPRLKRPRRA